MIQNDPLQAQVDAERSYALTDSALVGRVQEIDAELERLRNTATIEDVTARISRWFDNKKSVVDRTLAGLSSEPNVDERLDAALPAMIVAKFRDTLEPQVIASATKGLVEATVKQERFQEISSERKAIEEERDRRFWANRQSNPIRS